MGLRDFFKKKNEPSSDAHDSPPMTDEEKQLWWDQIEPLNVPVERRWRANEPRYPYRRKTDREGLAAMGKKAHTEAEPEPLEPWQLFSQEPGNGSPAKGEASYDDIHGDVANNGPDNIAGAQHITGTQHDQSGGERFDPKDMSWATQIGTDNLGPTASSAQWQNTNFDGLFGAPSTDATHLDDGWSTTYDHGTHNSNGNAEGFSFSADLDTVSEGMPWRELGLNSNATWPQVVERYRELVKTHHPDRHGSNDPEARKAAEEKMASINAAFDDLNEIYRLTDDT